MRPKPDTRDRKFPEHGSIAAFQDMIYDIYAYPGDRNFSLPDILSQQQRFAMRSLKGIRKANQKKLSENLVNTFSWAMTLANRLHIDMEEKVWMRFPDKCSYCGAAPCECKKTKPTKRAVFKRDHGKRPANMKGFQAMFEHIYPADTRTLEHAGVHMAEEMGEVSEAIHAFLGEHKKNQLESIEEETADFISCIFGVANSAGIDLAKETSKLFYKNCLACHKIPCECSMASINKFQS